jgi:hypothetical protein
MPKSIKNTVFSSGARPRTKLAGFRSPEIKKKLIISQIDSVKNKLTVNVHGNRMKILDGAQALFRENDSRSNSWHLFALDGLQRFATQRRKHKIDNCTTFAVV